MRIKRSQRRSAERLEESLDVIDDDQVAELDDEGGSRRAGGSSDGLDDAGPFGGDGDGDLDEVPIRGVGHLGDTLVEDRVARPRVPQTATMREGFHPRQFLHEVNVEMRKVAWPTRKETVNYSTVVFVTLAVLMGLIFGLDYAFNNLSISLFK